MRFGRSPRGGGAWFRIGSILAPMAALLLVAGSLVLPDGTGLPALLGRSSGVAGEAQSMGCRSVTGYGASTGRSDNGAAFQAALDAGSCIFVPTGEWRGISNVILRKDGTTVRCASRTTTILRPSGPADAVLIARAGTGLWIEDCSFRSFRAGMRQTAEALVVFDGTYNSGISGFSIDEAFRGLYDHRNGAFHARDGMIRNVTEYRIAIDGNTADHYFDTIIGDNNTVGDSLDPNQATAGVFIRSGGGITLTNIDMIHSGVPLWIRADGEGPVQWLYASAFAADTSRFSCMLFEARAGGLIQALSFVNSWSSNCREDGVRVVEAGGTIDGVAFTNQRAFTNYGHAMHLISGRNVEVVNPQFAGSTGTLVQVESTMGRFSLQGGRIGAAFGFGPGPGNIRIEPGRPGPFSIIGVDLGGANGETLSDASSTPGKVIFGNLGSRLSVATP